MPDETPTTPTAPPTGTESTPTTTTSTSSTPQPTQTPPSSETKPEAKADGSSLLNQKSDEKDAPKPDDKPAGPPEKYEAFKLPEGVELKPESLAAAQGLFKDLGLPQEGAQKLVDFHIKALQESAQAPLQAYQDMKDGWRKEAEALSDIGGQLGPGGKVNVAFSKMLDSLGDSKLANDFRSAMDLTGAGNHPAFIQVMWKLSQSFAEGGHVTGTGPSKHGQTQPGARPPTLAQAIYPKLPSSGV